MSGKVMGSVWDLDLPHNKMLVLLAMADHADHTGARVFPSFALIAWKTGYSYRQTLRIIKELEDDGILVAVRYGKQAGTVNEYRIDLSAGTLKDPLKTRKSDYAQGYAKKSHPDGEATPEGDGCDKMADHDTSKCHTRYDIQMAHEPSVEPSKDSIASTPPAGSRSEQTPAELAPTAQDSGGEVVEEQPAAQAPPPPKSKRPRKPQQLKTLADLTPMQRVIATNAFTVREGQGITERNMIRINLVVSEVTSRFGLNGDTVTPDELQRAYAWKRHQPRNSVIPKDGPKTGDMVQDHRDATGNGHRPTPPRPAGDPACPYCGGAGVVLPDVPPEHPDYNKQIPCVCVKEGHHVPA